VSGVLSQVFGAEGGLVLQVFSFHFLVMFFILAFVLLFLFRTGVSSEMIALFLIIFMILISIDNVFNVPPQFIVITIVMVVLYLVIIIYNFLRNK